MANTSLADFFLKPPSKKGPTINKLETPRAIQLVIATKNNREVKMLIQKLGSSILGGVFANQARRVLSSRAAKVMNPAKDEAVLSERRARCLCDFMRWKKFSTRWRLA